MLHADFQGCIVMYHYSFQEESSQDQPSITSDPAADLTNEDPQDLNNTSLKQEYRAYMIRVSPDADVAQVQAEVEAMIQQEQLTAEVSTGPRVLEGLEVIAIHCSGRVAARIEASNAVTQVLDVSDFQLRLPKSLLSPEPQDDES